MDFEGAVEAAVDKRKFLLNRVFQSIEIPEESSNGEEVNEASTEPPIFT